MPTADETTAQGTTEQLRDTARHVKENVRALGSQMRDVAGETISGLKDSASDYYRRGKIRARAAEENVIDYIREQPVKSLVIAVGAGLVLGFFLRRR